MYIYIYLYILNFGWYDGGLFTWIRRSYNFRTCVSVWVTWHCYPLSRSISVWINQAELQVLEKLGLKETPGTQDWSNWPASPAPCWHTSEIRLESYKWRFQHLQKQWINHSKRDYPRKPVHLLMSTRCSVLRLWICSTKGSITLHACISIDVPR